VRRHTYRVGQRLDDDLGPERPFFVEGCPADWEELPRPDLPLTVSLDGGYVHSARQRSRRDGWFEVIAGKSVPADGPAKCFGFVQTHDTKPKRGLFELLAAQGMQANQQVTFRTDGADDVRDLPLYLNPQAEHLLDWFHVTMRLTVLTQLAKGRRAPPPAASADSVAAQLARLKWFCWHGNVFRALQTVEDIEFDLDLDLDLDVDGAGPEQRKLCKAVGEFGGYLRANAASIPNYGERYRAGEVISSSLAESTINQVVSKRMVKKQQMRRTPRGAHLLLPSAPVCSTTTSPTSSALAPRLHPHHRRLASRARRCRVTSHGLLRSPELAAQAGVRRQPPVGDGARRGEPAPGTPAPARHDGS
jgi:hypothetical protein